VKLLKEHSWRSSLAGLIIAVVSFAGLGAISTLWLNPFFIRMTPVDGWEIGLLALLSILIGIYVVALGVLVAAGAVWWTWRSRTHPQPDLR